jgi:hypothetical protein
MYGQVKSEFGKESLFELGYISTDWGMLFGVVEWKVIYVQLMGPRGDGVLILRDRTYKWMGVLISAKIVNAFQAVM